MQQSKNSIDEALVRRLIAEHLGVALHQVTDEAHFQQDLGADSLDLIELTMLLETELGIEISDDESERCMTISHALACLRQKLPSETAGEPSQF